MITGCLIGPIIAISVLIVILHCQEKKERNYHVRAPEPIYDDPDSPHYTSCEDMKQVSSKKTSRVNTAEISLQEQPEMKENLAYGVIKQQQRSAEAEEQC